MIVKVCGLTERSDLALLGELPVDWGGLIFVRSSPRYAGRKPFDLPRGLRRIGVFRDEPTQSILRTAARWHLDAVQLHGRESPTAAAEIRASGLSVIKAIGVGDDVEASFAEALTFGPGHVDYLLFDTPGGGTGRAFDWAELDRYAGEVPFLLAGGIGPDSRAAIAEVRHPRWVGIDLNSRFEDAPGRKNLAALRSFLLP